MASRSPTETPRSQSFGRFPGDYALPPTTGARWLDPNFELIEAVAHTGNGLVDLWDASPVRLDSNEPKTDEIIDSLFPGNPLLCCGWTRHHFDTRPRKHWYKLHDLQFIVPNPMTTLQGLTRKAKDCPLTLWATQDLADF